LSDDALRRLRDWIRSGGTLVTIGEASRWAARDRIGLLSTDTLLRDGSAERERPEALAGALLRVRLDPNHWLSAGLDGSIQAVIEGSRVFAPLKLDAGRNVGVYESGDALVAAGLVWKEAQPLLAQRAFLMHQPLGRGHVIGFAEDPNYRAFTAATELLFINAVLLAPGH
jgi:hypothetical protein